MYHLPRPVLPNPTQNAANRTAGVLASHKEQGVLSPTTEHSGDCPVCTESAVILLQFSPCSHMACSVCWLTFLCTEVESFAMARLTCIACKIPLSASTVIRMLTSATKNPSAYGLEVNGELSVSLKNQCDKMLSRYEEFLLRRALAPEQDTRWCPNGCGYGLIAHGFKPCPQLTCPRPECQGRSFCYNCHRPWNNSTDEAAVAGTNVDPSTHTTDETVHICQSENPAEVNDTIEGVVAFFGLRRMRRRSSAQSDRLTSTSMQPRPSPTSRTSDSRNPITEETLSAIDVEAATPVSISSASKYAGHRSSFPRAFFDETDDNSSIIDPQLLSRQVSSAEGGEVKACPGCHALIQKLNDGSCNDMNCPVCSFNFCWLCLRENTPTHYISLSGCSVWGGQRWSPKKRILALLGIMLGTPIILPLILAIGIPVLTVAQIFYFCHQASSGLRNKTHLRRFCILLALLGGLIIAPITSLLLGAIFTPIALGYAYLYLPISVLTSVCKHTEIPEPVPLDELSERDHPSEGVATPPTIS